MESKNGPTEVNMKVAGLTTKQMEMENYIMLMETYTKAIGKMIKQMEKAHTFIKTEPAIKENGKMINSMGLARRLGPMEQYMMVNILRARRMGKESSLLLTVLYIVENLK
jgi:hypothetical protein